MTTKRRRVVPLFDGVYRYKRHAEDESFEESFAPYAAGTFVERLAAALRPAVVRALEAEIRGRRPEDGRITFLDFMRAMDPTGHRIMPVTRILNMANPALVGRIKRERPVTLRTGLPTVSIGRMAG